MTVDIFCDECGRKTEKLHRRYRGHRYCGSCYVRVFVKQQCPSCSCTARLPKNIPSAICRKCEAQKSCVRCGLSGKPIGKICTYGVVCASCAPYFREEEPCDVCSRLSHRLTRVSRFCDDLRRCERCAIADHGTCKACRRYRNLDASGGEKLCDLCSSGTEKICKSCGGSIPAGRGTQCESCYWMHLLERRALMSSEMLESKLLQKQFLDFSKWLGVNSGFSKAALAICRHVSFFQEIDRQWRKFPVYPDLLRFFGADHLRRRVKILEWLQVEHNYLIDDQLKKEVAEEHRVQRMLSKVPDKTKAQAVLGQYEVFLRSRLHHGKITIQTLRLSLTPAIALMMLSGYELPNSKLVSEYLKNRPGQRASLTGFISFLRNQYDLKIEILSRNDFSTARSSYLENKLLILMRKEWDNTDFIYWCKFSLELFHGLRLSIKIVISLLGFIKKDNFGYTFTYGNKEYFLPEPIKYNNLLFDFKVF